VVILWWQEAIKLKGLTVFWTLLMQRNLTKHTCPPCHYRRRAARAEQPVQTPSSPSYLQPAGTTNCSQPGGISSRHGLK